MLVDRRRAKKYNDAMDYSLSKRSGLAKGVFL